MENVKDGNRNKRGIIVGGGVKTRKGTQLNKYYYYLSFENCDFLKTMIFGKFRILENSGDFENCEFGRTVFLKILETFKLWNF